MEREIKFKIGIESEKTFEKILEGFRVHLANLELAGKLEIIDLGVEVQELVEER